MKGVIHMDNNKPFELIQHVFSTIVLDAIQFFPQNKKQVHAEAHGLLFGIEKERSIESDYAFPVGSVTERNNSSVQPDEKVDTAITSAKELFSTSECIGTYHSHPYDETFNGWADPSNGDCASANYLNLPYFLIIAITRNEENFKGLEIAFQESPACEFIHNPNVKSNEYPTLNKMDFKTTSIIGDFQKYSFTIRAYKNTGNSLVDVDLFSTEAQLLGLLNDRGLSLMEIPKQETYRLRKMEYNLRSENIDRGRQNLEYHMKQLNR